MAKEEIHKYMLSWDIDDNVGKIKLLTEGGVKGPITFAEAGEFVAVMTLLHNERPVYLDTENRRIFSGAESVGEIED